MWGLACLDVKMQCEGKVVEDGTLLLHLGPF